MRRKRRQSGFSLLEAMMASVLLAAATAGVLLPVVAAANAQTDAQRRVVATRFAADIIETLIAKGYEYIESLASPSEITPSAFDPVIHTDLAYEYIKAIVTTESVSAGKAGSEIPMIILTVKVLDNDRPVTTLKTLVGKYPPDN